MLVRQGAVFHFRRAVPQAIRPFFGKAEIWCSLRTFQERTATARAGVLYAASQRAFEAAMVALELMEASPEERELLLGITDELRQIAAVEEARSEALLRVAELRLLMSETKHAEDQVSLANRASAVFREAGWCITHLGGRLSEARRTGDSARAMVSDLARLAERLVSSPPAAAPAPALPPAPPARTASEFVEAHFRKRAEIDEATHQVIGQERTTVRLFLECCGDRPFREYKRNHVTGFLNKLRRMPATYGKSPKDAELSMDSLIARADEAEKKADGNGPVPRLSDKTVKRHLSALSQFLSSAIDEGELSQPEKAALVAEHAFRTSEAARDQRGAWTPEEMKALFASPVWTGSRSVATRSKPGTQIVRDAKFWLPLLAAFQGGRLEEFADLVGKDVFEQDGVPVVCFTPDVREDEGGEERKRRLKNKNAKRTVPLHPELIRLGFVDYVRATAPGPNDAVFPDIAPQGEDGKRGPRVTRWFVNYRREIGIYREGVAMHAFRHVANTRLRDAITDWQQERPVNYMLGHSLGGGEGGERYDKGPGLKAAAETLALLRYPELDLSHLYVR
jgi:integrase